MDLDQANDDDLYEYNNISCSEPLCFTCKSLYEAFESFQPTEIKLQMIDGGEKHWARYTIDRSYFEELTFKRSLKKNYTERNLQDFRYVEKVLEKIKKRFVGVFDRVVYVSCFAPVGKNYWTEKGANVQLKKYFTRMKYLVTNYASVQSTLSGFSDVFNCEMNSGGKMKGQSSSFPKEHETIEHLKKAKKIMGKRPFHVEILLAYFMMFNQFSACEFIIDNFDLDIGYFVHYWNIVMTGLSWISDERLEVLNSIYLKYPEFKIFVTNLPGNFENLEKYPFIVFDINRCMVYPLEINETTLSQFTNKYNINYHRVGKYGFSSLALRKVCNSLETLNPFSWDSTDIFGVTPLMNRPELLNRIPSLTIQQIMMKDINGNNFLHYYFNEFNKYQQFKSYADTPLSKFIPNDILIKLEQEENNVGWTPVELAVITERWKHFEFQPITKIFHYSLIENTFKFDIREYKLLDGCEINLPILYSIRSQINQRIDYSIYRDINYRDGNGKHLIHYFTNCDFEAIKKIIPNLSEEEILLTQDENGTMPLHSCINSYKELLSSIVAWKTTSAINISGYFDNLGFNRIMYSLLKFHDERSIHPDATVIGFDYSTPNDPQLVHITIQNQHDQDTIHFKLERTSIPRITSGFQWFDGEEGDDISHLLIRTCLHQLSTQKWYYLEELMNILIARGLKFDIVKNSKGKTASDLVNEFKERNPHLDHSPIYKQVTRGSSKKSKAKEEFLIRYSKCPAEEIISQTSDLLVVKKSFVLAGHEVNITRNLFFEHQKQRKELLE